MAFCRYGINFIKRDVLLYCEKMKDIIYKIFIILIVITAYVYCHESVHDRIFNIYECEDIEYGFDKRGIYTTAICGDEAKLPTALNEVIGYTVSLPLFVIIIMLLLRD